MEPDTKDIKQGNAHLTVVAFTVLVVAIVALALITTLNRVDVRATNTANTDLPPGATGLAYPHPPLQRNERNCSVAEPPVVISP